MGSEDLFHKRKARKATDFFRKINKRPRSSRFLIVCEGTKTEPHYFRELLDDLRIHPSWVHIAKNDGSSPDRIVAHAIALYEEDALTGDSFDKVFCIFDRDAHETFDAAVKRISDLKSSPKPKPLEAITSTPCFEFWFLLHFGFTDKPFHASGKKSIGDQVVEMLKTKSGFKNYRKGKRDTYVVLKDKMTDAIKSAAQLRECLASIANKNPSTNVDELILELRALAPQV